MEQSMTEPAMGPQFWIGGPLDDYVLRTNWSSGDELLGTGQLMAFGKVKAGQKGYIQAHDAITLGRSQIVAIAAADKLVRDARLKLWLLGGKISAAEFAQLGAEPMPPERFGDWKVEAQSLRDDPNYAQVGQICESYFAVCHFIRKLLRSHRKTDQVSVAPPAVPPGSELPGLPGLPGLTLPVDPPTGWPPSLPWPGKTGGDPGDILTPPAQPPATGNWWEELPWFQSSAGIAQGAPTIAIVITILGVAGIAGATYYGVEKEKAGIKIEAERAFAQWQSHMQIEIARMKLAAGQAVELPEFMSRAAQIEEAQSSPLMWAGAGVLLGGLAIGGAFIGKKQIAKRRARRPNPCPTPNPRRARRSSRRKQCKIDGTQVTVEVHKLKRGFSAYYLGPTKKVRIAIPECRTYDQAFKEACKALRAAKRRARRKKNPKTIVTKRKTKTTKIVQKNPKRKKKAAAKARPTKAAFIRRQMRKGRTRAQAEADWKFRQRMAKGRRKKKTTKKKTTRRKANPKKARRKKGKTERAHGGLKAGFIRKQRRKGRSQKQAEADWKARARLRKLRKK
jgi:hypothetical protein